jgi:hypothetical protein
LCDDTSRYSFTTQLRASSISSNFSFSSFSGSASFSSFILSISSSASKGILASFNLKNSSHIL